MPLHNTFFQLFYCHISYLLPDLICKCKATRIPAKNKLTHNKVPKSKNSVTWKVAIKRIPTPNLIFRGNKSWTKMCLVLKKMRKILLNNSCKKCMEPPPLLPFSMRNLKPLLRNQWMNIMKKCFNMHSNKKDKKNYVYMSNSNKLLLQQQQRLQLCHPKRKSCFHLQGIFSHLQKVWMILTPLPSTLSNMCP